jgi:hypothetical protein
MGEVSAIGMPRPVDDSGQEIPQVQVELRRHRPRGDLPRDAGPPLLDHEQCEPVAPVGAEGRPEVLLHHTLVALCGTRLETPLPQPDLERVLQPPVEDLVHEGGLHVHISPFVHLLHHVREVPVRCLPLGEGLALDLARRDAPPGIVALGPVRRCARDDPSVHRCVLRLVVPVMAFTIGRSSWSSSRVTCPRIACMVRGVRSPSPSRCLTRRSRSAMKSRP